MRSVRSPRRPHEVEPVRVSFSEPGLTRQSFKDECDINRIVDQYTRTGLVPHVVRRSPQYGDVPEQSLFEAACVQAEIRSAEEHAELYPSPEALSGSETDDQDVTNGEVPETEAPASEAPQGASDDES